MGFSATAAPAPLVYAAIAAAMALTAALVANRVVRLEWREVAAAAGIALLGGLLCKGLAPSLAIGLISALGIVDARSGRVPFAAALPLGALVLLSASVTVNPWAGLFGAAAVAGPVALVLFTKDRPIALLFATPAWIAILVGGMLHAWPLLLVGFALWTPAIYLGMRGSTRVISGGDLALAAIVGAGLGLEPGYVALLVAAAAGFVLWAVFVRGHDRALHFGPSIVIGALVSLASLNVGLVR